MKTIDKTSQKFIDKIYANEPLKITDEIRYCRVIELLRTPDNKKAENIFNFSSCKNYVFRACLN